MKIAIIHDYLTSYGGAEKTFKTLTEIFPQAKVFTLFYDPKIKKKLFPYKKIQTSFLQKFPFKKKYRWFLPFLPIATESLDFRDFDIKQNIFVIVILLLDIYGIKTILNLFFIFLEYGTDKLVKE